MRFVKFINRLSDALYIMARMEDYVQFVETIVERVSERVTTSRKEILTGSNQCVGNIEQTAENGVNDMTTESELEHIMTKLSQAAMDYAQSIGVPIVVSIVDANGVLMYFQRMSDALLISNDIAQAKAYTAVALKAATHEVHQSAQPDGDLFNIESMVNRKSVPLVEVIRLSSTVKLSVVSALAVALWQKIWTLHLMHYNLC